MRLYLLGFGSLTMRMTLNTHVSASDIYQCRLAVVLSLYWRHAVSLIVVSTELSLNLSTASSMSSVRPIAPYMQPSCLNATNQGISRTKNSSERQMTQIVHNLPSFIRMSRLIVGLMLWESLVLMLQLHSMGVILDNIWVSFSDSIYDYRHCIFQGEIRICLMVFG